MRGNSVFRASVVAAALLAAPMASARVWYVNTAATLTHDGSSFAHGFTRIQDGINAAAVNDHVDVAQGTYVENLHTNKGLSLNGGFSGADDGSLSDPIAHHTFVDGGGSAAVYVAETTGEVGLFGLTIQNGAGTTSGGKKIGGGVALIGADAIVDNCIFRFNTVPTASGYGGAICSSGGSLIVERSTFTTNKADLGGAIAVLANSFAETVQTSLFDGNTFSTNATSQGGAVYVEAISFEGHIASNVFQNNSADFGGAIDLNHSNNQTISDNTFTSNSAQPLGDAGALLIEHSDPVTVTRNVFTSNTAQSYGGAVYSDTAGAASVAINSNAFINNTCSSSAFSGISGGALVIDGAFLVNNTIVGNNHSAVSIAGPSYTANNIIAFNGGGISKDSSVLPGPLHSNDVFGNSTDYVNITDATGISGNTSADPLLVNRAAGDLHLLGTSPCIDSGNTDDSLAFGGPRDFDVETRIAGAAVDIGADEFLPTLVFITQPGSGRPGQLLNPEPVVAMQDRGGNLLPLSGVPIFINSIPLSAPLTGTTTVNTVNGVATFTDLTFGKASKGDKLEAFSSSASVIAENAISLPFDILLQRSFVKTTGDDTKDGSSWADAKQTISSAFTLTSGPDAEVWVATGTYTGPLSVPTGITLFGGFDGTETLLSQRNAKSRATVVNGGGGTAAVRFTSGSGNGIDGFRITGGIGFPVTDISFLTTHREGGGVYVNNASPRITNNLITANSATIGGGIAVDSGHPFIGYNTISFNTAAATPSLAGLGGGVVLDGSGETLADNLIFGNAATGQTTGGGGSAGSALVIGNPANARGGPHDVHNNTFVNNQSPATHGDIVLYSGTPSFVNNIVNNHAAIEKIAGSPTFNHNDYIPGLAVTNQLPNIAGSNGNINQAVSYVNAAGNNYHLTSGSTLKDIGDVSVIDPGETDVDLEPRVMGAGVDLGADEVTVPYSLADANIALAIAGGLQTATLIDRLRLDRDLPAGIDVADAVRIIRKATGLDANP